MRYNVHAGHNKYVSGASKYLDEVTENRKVANELIALLNNQGQTVYNSTDDSGTTASRNLNNIVNKCNQHRVDADVSIHLNAGGGSGVEIWIYSHKSSVKQAAERICANISKALNIPNRGVKISTQFYVLRKTVSPAMIIECCFVDSQNDAAKWNAQKCAHAIAEGLLNRPINISVGVEPYSGTITSRIDGLAYHSAPSWSDSTIAGHINKGTVLTVVGRIKINTTYMYKTKAGWYITSAPKYVIYKN